MIKLDILAIAAHPDDVELAASGTLIKHIRQGKKAGIVDLTKGELGSRGSAELRTKEAAISAELMKLDARVNLDLGDGFFENSKEELIKLIEQIRYFHPTIVLANSTSDRHPDHGRASSLIDRACFLSGLRKIKTRLNGDEQEAWRPEAVYHYIQDNWHEPDIVVDITNEFELKMETIKAFGSQFYDPDSTEPETPISSPEFMKHVEGRAVAMGRLIGVSYGEGFTVNRPIGTDNLLDLK